MKLFLKKMAEVFIPLLFHLFRIFPLQNKVVATNFRGRKYADNPRYIVEKINELYPAIKVVWIRNGAYNYNVGKEMKCVSRNSVIRYVYEYATAKVWIDSHIMRKHLRKRKGQICIQTWHGGLGIKKIEMDMENVTLSGTELKELQYTCELADVFLSNSDFLSGIYRNAFKYLGPILKCGFPRNDHMLDDNSSYKKQVRRDLSIAEESRLLLYAPTFRDNFSEREKVDLTPYAIDFNMLLNTLEEKWGGKWKILVKWHPVMQNYVNPANYESECVKDVTSYADMQKLIKGVDVLISDYSSCLFDAAFSGIPSFVFATDFEKYKAGRGTYFEMDELPFPYAQSNECLRRNVLEYDKAAFERKWKDFAQKQGLTETGIAAEIVSVKINDFIKNGKVCWD